jgi:cysteinyl-tRNA synthetase
MLKIYNTLSREVEAFQPINKAEVTFYTCGPTVYDYPHIGNLRAYLVSDLLRRVLEYDGYKVKQVINITDVGHLTNDNDDGEDKIEKSAKLESKSANEVADFYTGIFKEYLHKLNIQEPTIWAKATEYIDEQIELVKKLEVKGFVYKTSDGLYFDTSKLDDYGKLARLNLMGQEEGARVVVNKEKKNPTDFAVWKFSPKDQKRQMEWDSPWGVGFPGWHIECSAMSMKLLGETIDIHAGGIDHVPVHHTNEIAQSEAVTGKKFVNYWVHNEFLVVNKEKMAKSEGNFVTLDTLIEKGIDPMAYRFFCIGAHYRSKLNFSWEALATAQSGWTKLKTKFLSLGEQDGQVDDKLMQRFIDNVNNDVALPEALAVVWEVLKSDLPDYDKRATLLEMDKILGFDFENIQEVLSDVPEEVEILYQARLKARENKNWEKSDDLRKKIEELGWLVEDSADTSKLVKK